MEFEKLRQIVAGVLNMEAGEISMDTRFADDLGADSLDLVELIMSVEEAFDLGEVEDGTLENVKTVGDVVQFITSRVGE